MFSFSYFLKKSHFKFGFFRSVNFEVFEDRVTFFEAPFEQLKTNFTNFSRHFFSKTLINFSVLEIIISKELTVFKNIFQRKFQFKCHWNKIGLDFRKTVETKTKICLSFINNLSLKIFFVFNFFTKMGWDPKIEGIPKIDGMLSYLQSVSIPLKLSFQKIINTH